jgi:hypothetical protein
MNRRIAIANLAALSLAGCAGEAVYVQGDARNGVHTFIYRGEGAPPLPTEADYWANPTAHGLMPLQFIRNELLRQTAADVIAREEQQRAGHNNPWLSGHINGIAMALRLMGVEEDLTEEWALGIVATLGQPMCDRTNAHWTYYPGNNAWRRLQKRATPA